MIIVQVTGYTSPVAEQEFASLTPTPILHNIGTVAVDITGIVNIYRTSTGAVIYTSQLRPGPLAVGESLEYEALTPWSPPAPLDDEYFITCQITAVSIPPAEPDSKVFWLGPYAFDIKPVGMGPAPAAHGSTHEDGGSDELEISDLATSEVDDTLVLAPDGAGGVEFRAESGGGGSGLSETPQTLTDQAAIDWDLALGGAATVTLAGDRTLNEATNMVDGSHASLRIIQDGTGTRLLTWHASYRFPGGVDPALSAAAGNIDILQFNCDGTNMDCVGMVSAVA